MTTDNQGQTWTRQQFKQGLKYDDLYSVAFTTDGSSGWAVGDEGMILRSEDRGATWTQQKAPAGSGSLMTVAVADAKNACAGSDHGAIVCTSDGGANWSLQKVGDLGLFDLIFIDANNGWGVGEFQAIVHSSDGGKTWKLQSGGDRVKTPDPYFAIAFSGQNGLAVGLAGSAVQSTDGGNTWKPDNYSIERKSFYAAVSIPTPAGAFYMAGEDGVAAQLAGGQLSQVNTDTSNAIAAVAFSDHFAMAVGLSGTLLISDDGGHHWHALNNQALESQGQ